MIFLSLIITENAEKKVETIALQNVGTTIFGTIPKITPPGLEDMSHITDRIGIDNARKHISATRIPASIVEYPEINPNMNWKYIT
jgi:hypothetical protein